MAQLAGTIKNPAGKHISWSGLHKANNIINQSAALFGLTVVSFEAPTFGDYFNTDALAARLSQIVKQRRKSPVTPGHAAEFLGYANQLGFTMSGGSLLAGVADLTVGTITDTGGIADWTNYTSAASYNYIVTLNGNHVQSGNVLVSTKTLTGLTAETTYVISVQAVLTNGSLSNWSTFEFTTLETP